MYLNWNIKPTNKSPILTCILCPNKYIELPIEIMYNHRRLCCPFCESYLTDDGQEKPLIIYEHVWLWNEPFFI